MKPGTEALFERHHARVYRYFRQVTGRHEDAQELVQELFLRLLRGWRTYQASGRETEWVFRAARNLALDYRRKQAMESRGGRVDPGMATTNAPQLAAFSLTEALGLLTAGDRDLLVLRELAGLTYKELAAACESTPTAVSQRLYRIRNRLRRLLKSRVASPEARTRSDKNG
jgi:RNA polymerase sigma-70 factor, ECF subfamily